MEDRWMDLERKGERPIIEIQTQSDMEMARDGNGMERCRHLPCYAGCAKQREFIGKACHS